MTNTPIDISFTLEDAQERTAAMLPEYAHDLKRIADLISDAAQDEISSLAETLALRMEVDPEEDEEHFVAIQDAIFIRALEDLMGLDLE